MSLSQILKTIDTIKTHREKYCKLNLTISKLQGDFPTLLQAIDVNIETEVVRNLDEQIEDICGLKEMASYYLYECYRQRGGAIHDTINKKEFRIKTIKDLKRVINYFTA